MLKISLEELKYNTKTKIYNNGYRIVYFYEKHHEILKLVCTEKIEDLSNYCDLKKENFSNKEILEKYLELNPNAYAAAIYEIKTGKEIERIYREAFKGTISDYVMFQEELMYDYDVDNFIDGYRIVYFKRNGDYEIGTFCKTIEGFMVEFCDREPIDDESEIPPFISVDDIVERYLNSLSQFESVAMYKTDGTCILRKYRENRKII